MLRPDIVVRGVALATLLLAPSLTAQERTVVGKQISVGASETLLQLDFDDDGSLRVALRDGAVYVDGERIGAASPGSDVEGALRGLLGLAVALDDGPLSEQLVAWAPPAGLEGEALRVARRVDQALEDALRGPSTAPTGRAAAGQKDDPRLLGTLLRQVGHLGLLEAALSDLDDDVDVHLGSDVEIGEGETRNGSILVFQGDARVAGAVRGHLVVIEGTVEMFPGSRIDGDVRLVDGRLENDGGTVHGDVVDLLDGDARVDVRDRELRDEVRAELREELRNQVQTEVRNEFRGDDRERGGLLAPVRAMGRAVGGVLENMLLVAVLGLVGLGFTAFAGGNLDVVAETARRSPGRAAVVGVAGSFLLIPVWILGAVVLAVSIVGLPVMIAWLPLFPLAACAAVLLGFVAVARNTGEWLSESDFRYTDWIRRSNSVYTILGGLLAFVSFFVVADVLGVVPWFGFFQGLLTVVGTLTLLVAAQIGFGAVLLSRAGRRSEWPLEHEEAWRRAVSMDDEPDVEPMSPDDPAVDPHA